MKAVSIRDLRNHGGEVLDRVSAGDSVTVTRGGTPIAQIVPLRRRPLDRATLMARWRPLPPIDVEAFQRDLDDLLDPSL